MASFDIIRMPTLGVMGAGFLGKHLIHDLLTKENDYDKILPMDIVPKETWMEHPIIKNALENAKRPEQLEYREVIAGDILTLKDDFKNGIDQIVYTAAIADVPVVEKNPTHAVEINEVHIVKFIEALRAFDFNGTMILMSSESIYGKQPPEKLHIVDSKYKIKTPNNIVEEKMISTAQGIKEDEGIPNPENLYGATKLGQETKARPQCRKYGIKLVILRSATMYGPFARVKQLVPTFCKQVLEQKPITLMGDGVSTSRDFAYVTDQVVAIKQALKYGPQLDGEIINIGSGRETFLLGLANAIKMLCNQKDGSPGRKEKYPYVPIKRLPFRPGEEGLRMCLDITKAKEKLGGWMPAVNLVDGLKFTLRHILTNEANVEQRYQEEMFEFLRPTEWIVPKESQEGKQYTLPGTK